ncbi:hypothetical protein [Marinobacter fonticola]|uniref:hypothetical protein n=1 Tax=Marinobacter fonticola TaxID=2603215 RepID=UPI0011E7256C|nr:hypothetical protein [Marinobacter fonticola]
MKTLAPVFLAAMIGASFANAGSGLADRANEARSYPTKTENVRNGADCGVHKNMPCNMMEKNPEGMAMCQENMRKSSR